MRAGLVLLFCLLSFAAPARAGYALEVGRIGNWDTITWMTDSHRFAYCGAQRQLDGGGAMFVSVGAAGLLMSVDLLNQSLAPGRDLAVVLRVDQSWSNGYDAQVQGQPGSSILMIRLGWDTAAFDALRGGNWLALLSQHFGYDVSLAGSNDALTHIRDCAERHINRSLLR